MTRTLIEDNEEVTRAEFSPQRNRHNFRLVAEITGTGSRSREFLAIFSGEKKSTAG